MAKRWADYSASGDTEPLFFCGEGIPISYYFWKYWNKSLILKKLHIRNHKISQGVSTKTQIQAVKLKMYLPTPRQ